MIEGITFEPPPTLFIIAAVMVGILIGWVIGFLDSNLRSVKKIETAESRAQLAIEEAQQKMAEAERKLATAGAEASGPAAQPIRDDPGLLRLRNRSGVVALEIDGVPALEKPLPPERKGRLIELLTLVRPWVEGGPGSRPAEPSAAQPAPSPRPAAPAVAPFPPAAAARSPEGQGLRALSIVAQIDSVLQQHLADTPLAGKGIRLSEGPSGAVEVYVGLQKFAAIDDVPDRTIQATIRSAIAKWEEKFTPGA
jgi:hypothetical protein